MFTTPPTDLFQSFRRQRIRRRRCRRWRRCWPLKKIEKGRKNVEDKSPTSRKSTRVKFRTNGTRRWDSNPSLPKTCTDPATPPSRKSSRPKTAPNLFENFVGIYFCRQLSSSCFDKMFRLNRKMLIVSIFFQKNKTVGELELETIFQLLYFCLHDFSILGILPLLSGQSNKLAHNFCSQNVWKGSYRDKLLWSSLERCRRRIYYFLFAWIAKSFA